jgi:hypothetical protein
MEVQSEGEGREGGGGRSAVGGACEEVMLTRHPGAGPGGGGESGGEE